VRGAAQVGAAGARVPTRREPDVRGNEALEFTSEGDGAPEAKGAHEAATTTSNSPFQW